MRDNGGVSDPQDTPQPRDPERSAAPGDAVERVDPLTNFEGSGPEQRVARIEIDETIDTYVSDDVVTVRRAPRFGGFIILGVVVGVVVALILTFAFSGQPVDPGLVGGFDKGQVFGFLLLVCGTLGAALGAVTALLIDRASAKRARKIAVVHESTHRIDE